jgi:hypothetical protein
MEFELTKHAQKVLEEREIPVEIEPCPPYSDQSRNGVSALCGRL